MKKILLLLLLFVGVNAIAQKPEWGRAIEAARKDYTPTIVGEDDSYIYTADMVKEKELLLEQYDKKNFRQKYSRNIPVPRQGRKRYDVEKISFFGDKFLVFASFYDRKSHQYELRVFAYSADRAKLEGDYPVLSYEVEKRRRKGDFAVHSSRNRETILIHYHTYFKETDNTVEEIKLYDRDLNELVAKSYLADGRVGARLSNIIIDDEGSIYFLRDNSVAILDATVDFEEWSEPIIVENMEFNGKLSEVYMTLNSSSDVVLVANYLTTDLEKTDEKKRRRDRRKNDTQVEGVYFMRINGLTKETEVAQLSKFSQDYLDQFRSKRDVKKGRKSEMNNDYDSFKFFFKDDGGIVFAAEELDYYVITDGNGRVKGENYEYLDLVTYNFTPDGELLWANRIPKDQSFYWYNLDGYGILNTTSYGYTWFRIPYYAMGHFSYLAGLSEDKFYVVFNDHKKNMAVKNDFDKLKTMRKVKKAVPMVYEIDLETGIKTKRMDLAYNSGDTRFKPSVSYQASQTEPLYIFSMFKKSFRFGKIDFNDTDQKGKGRKTARR